MSVRRIADDGELFQLPGAGACDDYDGLAFSPDGRFLRVRPRGRRQDILWRIDGPAPVQVATFEGVDISPDSKRLAVTSSDGTIRILNTESLLELRRFDKLLPNARAAWNPKDPQQILMSDRHSSNPEPGNRKREWVLWSLFRTAMVRLRGIRMDAWSRLARRITKSAFGTRNWARLCCRPWRGTGQAD